MPGPVRTSVQTKDGQTRSYYPPESLEVETAPDPIQQFTISFRTLDVSVAAKLDLAAIFKASVDAKGTALLFDATANTGWYKEATNGGAVEYGIRRGIGLRVAVLATQLDAKVSLNFAAVAANAAITKQRADYEVVAIGLPEDVVGELIAGAPLQAALSDANYFHLQQAINVKLPKYLRERAAAGQTLPLARYKVDPIGAITSNPTVRARSINFAMIKLAARFNLNGALLQAKDRFDHDLITLIYGEVADLRDPTKQPSDAVVATATRWLSWG